MNASQIVGSGTVTIPFTAGSRFDRFVSIVSPAWVSRPNTHPETVECAQFVEPIMRVSVIGGSTVDEDIYALAREIGQKLAENGHTVICGGLTGVMEATARGVAERSGTTIGIVPGTDRSAANEFVDTVIATGLGNARNALVAMNGDAVIAIDGGPGTLSEIGHSLDFEKPIVGLETYDVPGVPAVADPEAAVEYVESKNAGN